MTESEAIKELQVVYLGDTEDLVKAKHIAINALEKQIAKKPIPLIDKIFGITYSFMCPCCNYEGLGGNECRFARCENCGREFLWTANKQSNWTRNSRRKCNKGKKKHIFCSNKCAGSFGRKEQLGRNT